MSQTVAAVIPTYRPDGAALLTLTRALMATGTPLLVADDASPCTADNALATASAAGAVVTRHARNVGIARSLNQGLAFAADHDATWLLTVDQDSQLPDSHIERLLAAAHDAERQLGDGCVGAVAAGAIEDASGVLRYPLTQREGILTTQEVIQTGTLWAVAPLRALGGFDERLGIDAVDAGACLALRAAGLLVVLARDATVTHRVGDGHQVRILGHDVLASGHSPSRRTTIVRNRLRLFPRELRQSPTHAFRTLRRVVIQTGLAVTVEEDRWAKAKGAARGLLPDRSR